MSDYVRREFYLIKLHGSLDWAHPVRDLHIKTNESIEGLIRKIIDRTPGLDIAAESFEIVPEYPFDRGLTPFFPGIAIPVENKSGYECPQDHITTLEKCLPQVDRILVIGWRASEKRFLDTLAKGLSKDARWRRVMVVSSNEQSASETIKRIRGGAVGAAEYLTGKGGFSQFIFSPEANDFLKS